MPVARRLTARMGFPARPTRLGYQISKCEECDLHFADDTMQRHMALVHGRVKLRPESTSAEHIRTSGLSSEQTNIGGEAQMAPSDSHINTYVHNGEVNYANVTQHGNTTLVQSNLQQSVTVAQGNGGNLQCGQCDYKPGRMSSLLRHIQVAHDKRKNTPDKTLSCGQCNYKGRRYNVQRHINVVHNKMKFKCEHCTFENAQRDKLHKHVKVHGMTQDTTSSIFDNQISQNTNAHAMALQGDRLQALVKKQEYQNQSIQTVPGQLQDTFNLMDDGGNITVENGQKDQVATSTNEKLYAPTDMTNPGPQSLQG